MSGYLRRTIRDVKKRLKAGDDPELDLLFYLFHTHHWGLADLRDLQSSSDGWQEIIREFSAFEVTVRKESQ